jgi:hypothetical protein
MTTSKIQSILFFTPYGEWRVHNQLDVTVAAALRARNCKIRYLTCAGLYQPCAITRAQQDCTRCQTAMAETLSPFDLCSASLRNFMISEDALRADAWVADLSDEALSTACFDNLPVGEWALSAVMTHFRVSQARELVDRRIVPVHRRFVRYTLLTYWAIDRLLTREKFDAVFLFNARFYPYRAAFEAARRRGVRILVHERGRIGNSFALFENENCLGVDTARRLTKAWSGVALDEHEIERLNKHFSDLRLGRSSSWPAFYDSVRNFDPRAVLDVPYNAKLVGFFTSSQDELAHSERFGDPKRQFELIDNVAQAIDGTDVYLLVRHHPHIGGAANSEVEVVGFYEAYRRALSRHKNVRTIMPIDDLSSYALFPYLTAAIAPFSSIGMELVAFGVPTLVSDASDADFDQRFILSDRSPQDLKAGVDFITSPEAQLGVEDLRRFYRQCYCLLFRSSVEFNVIGIKDFFKPISKFDTIDALLPGNDAGLDRICNHLFFGSSSYELPCEATEPRSNAAEDLFIREQLATIEKHHRALGASLAQPNSEQPQSKTFAVIIDEAIEGNFASRYWSGLPHAQNVSTKSFSVKMPARGIFRAFLTRETVESNREFPAWALELRHLLGKTNEDYVLVTNARFQFHDTSIAVIAAAVESANSLGQPVIALAGWLRDPNQIAPLRMQPVKADLPHWREMRQRFGVSFRPQDILASVVLRREWLIECLNKCRKIENGADAFEDAVFEAVISQGADISVTQPVFLLC